MIARFQRLDARLFIEVGGGQLSASSPNATHNAHFESADFTILHFWNDEVERNLDGVCRHILHVAGKL